jgi:hypothetical protein
MEEDALANLFTGAPPEIKLSGTRFIVSKDGEDHAIDRTSIGLIILRAKGPFDKVFYNGAYTPGDEPTKPDCFSRDGIVPDPSVEYKCAASCAGCAKNQFGTGKTATGEPSDGKACRDIKITAVTPGSDQGAFKFKIPPASLGNFAKYVASLRSRGIHMAEAITMVSFDIKVSYPKLTFTFGGLADETVLSYVYELIDSVEVRDIIKVPNAAALPAPVQQAPVQQAPVQEQVPENAAPGFGSFGADISTPNAQAPPKNNRKVREIKPAAKAEEAHVETAPDATVAFGGFAGNQAPAGQLGGFSDADLSAKLGL